MENQIRILVADDHPVVRDGLSAIIQTQPDMVVVAEASNGREAVESYRKHRPDIALLDLRMPEMDAVQAIIAIRKDFPNAKVIVLTTFHADEEIYRVLQAGARAYLLKDIPRKELLEAIRAVHAGHRRIPPEVAEKLAARIPGVELTAREMDVLKLIVKGMSNKEIAATLHISEGTVKSYINIIFTKLGVSDRTQAATTALQRGLVHLEE